MDYETWMKVKDACLNDDMRPWCRMPDGTRKAMKYAHAAGAIIETLTYMGEWVATENPGWQVGIIYRVAPSWPGPAKPEPAPEYEDKDVFLVGATYRFIRPSEEGTQWFITAAPAMVGFVVYVYEINGGTAVRSKWFFESHTDGTYRLRVPKAVRFLKGATA